MQQHSPQQDKTSIANYEQDKIYKNFIWQHDANLFAFNH